MSNTSATETSPIDLTNFIIILSIIEKYLMVIFYIFGFFGSLLNIFMFLQKRFRNKSCSIYLLLNSFVDFSYINSFLLISLIDLLNSKIFLTINSTNLWCKLGNYFYFLLPCLSSTYITFASIDRFCASSLNNKLQKFNQLSISYLFTLMIFFIWSLFSLHIPISYNLIRLTPSSSIQCNPQMNVAIIFILIDGFFFALFNGIINPGFLIIFGLLIVYNVQNIHRQISPQQISSIISRNNQDINQRLTRTNQHLITMVLFQVGLTILLHIPYIVLYLYQIYNSPPTYWLGLLFYIMFSYLGRWFWFLNYCKTFYINICSSKTFRNIFKRKILLLIGTNHHEILPHQTNQRQTSPDSAFSTETPHPTMT